MAKRGLNQMDGRAVIERMAGVRVSKPVGADGAGNANLPDRLAHDHADASAVERFSGAGRKDRILGARRPPEADQFRPHAGGQGDGPRTAVLAEQRRRLHDSCSQEILGTRRSVEDCAGKPAQSFRRKRVSYTIYAVKAEQDRGYLIDALFQELRQGRARFGWSYDDSLDPRDLKARIAHNGWNSLSEEEQKCIAKTGFFLDVRPGDYFVYINMPSYGRCAAVRIADHQGIGPDHLFQYTSEWGDPPQHDFRSMLPCEFLFDFDRNANVVHPYLSRRLKLMGAHWTIGDTEKFEELLRDLHAGARGKAADERLRDQIEEHLCAISDRIRQTYPEKNLESFVLGVLARLPRIQDAKKGPDVDGADLVFTFDGGIETLDLERTEVCAVQVKCYENIVDDLRAVEDIKRAFSSGTYTCGLIVTTAQSVSERFQSALDNLREQSGKPVGLILARDLAALFLRYGQDRSGS